MLVLSESFHVFESRIACRYNRFPSRRRRRAALSIWHQLTQSIQRGESSFQEKCMDFHEIHARVAYDLAHVCISWSVHTNKWRTTNNALCGYYKFSFRIFIWVYLNFSEYKQLENSGFLIEINFIAILNAILFNIFTLSVKRYLAKIRLAYSRLSQTRVVVLGNCFGRYNQLPVLKNNGQIIWDWHNLFEGRSPIILRGRREKGMHFSFSSTF